MCVIMAKPKGIDMPDDEIIQNMWCRNSDGAGFMYAKDGQVHIEKGFMKLAALKAALKKVGKSVDLKNTAVVMHFRITTHGGTKPENTHPFPITDSIGMLKKLKQTAKVGVAHNGIIPITPRKDISDTMEYIASQLAPLKRAVPKFYTDPNLMLMIANATQSKLAFLTGDGKIFTVGKFITDDGRLYSNTSYEPWVYKKYTGAYWGYGSAWTDDDDDAPWDATTGNVKSTPLLPEGMNALDYEIRTVDWLRSAEGDFLVSPEGEWYESDDACVDENGIVYIYSFDFEALVPLLGFTAYTGNGNVYRFNENHAIISEEMVYLGDDADAEGWLDTPVYAG